MSCLKWVSFFFMSIIVDLWIIHSVNVLLFNYSWISWWYFSHQKPVQRTLSFTTREVPSITGGILERGSMPFSENNSQTIWQSISPYFVRTFFVISGHRHHKNFIHVYISISIVFMYFMCASIKFFLFQCGPEKPNSWAALRDIITFYSVLPASRYKRFPHLKEGCKPCWIFPYRQWL